MAFSILCWRANINQLTHSCLYIAILGTMLTVTKNMMGADEVRLREQKMDEAQWTV